MSNLKEIKANLESTRAAIARTEKLMGEYPDEPTLSVTLVSLERRYANLEEAFNKLTHQSFLDVCKYRLFHEDEEQENYSITGITKSLLIFQSAVTLLFDALRNGPKQRNSPTQLATDTTSFSFGYSFEGSVGIACTLPNDRLLVDSTDIDKAIDLFFEIAKANSSDQVAQYAFRVGAAPIRLMYQWGKTHIESEMGADIEWKRDSEVRLKLLAQLPDMKELVRVIEETSDDVEERLSVLGELVGADVNSHTFHLRVAEDGAEIRGKMARELASAVTVELPKNYIAGILKTTRVNYATDNEEVRYLLVSLEEVKAGDYAANTLPGSSFDNYSKEA